MHPAEITLRNPVWSLCDYKEDVAATSFKLRFVKNEVTCFVKNEYTRFVKNGVTFREE